MTIFPVELDAYVTSILLISVEILDCAVCHTTELCAWLIWFKITFSACDKFECGLFRTYGLNCYIVSVILVLKLTNALINELSRVGTRSVREFLILQVVKCLSVHVGPRQLGARACQSWLIFGTPCILWDSNVLMGFSIKETFCTVVNLRFPSHVFWMFVVCCFG